jgi:hypothetical protein
MHRYTVGPLGNFFHATYGFAACRRTHFLRRRRGRLWLGIKEAARDMHRWELDPASAEDWAERRKR